MKRLTKEELVLITGGQNESAKKTPTKIINVSLSNIDAVLNLIR